MTRQTFSGAVRLLLFLVVAIPCAMVQAQEKPFGESISVGYVMVPFIATDANGKPVKTLRERDVQLLVGGEAVKTDLFERSDNAPVSFTILLDASGSMGLAGKHEAALAAIAGIVRHKRKGDDYALYAFARGEVKEVVPFTTDAAKIYFAAKDVKPFGRTAFFDALALMPDKSILGQNGSRAILLLTDGLDNASRLTQQQLAQALEGVDVPVYALGLRMSNDLADADRDAETLSDVETLERISALTGGRVFLGIEPREIAAAVDQINQDLRTQYLVGFTPTGRGDVKYRAISLKLPRSVRAVRVRSGYRGTEPPLSSVQSTQREKTRRKGTNG